MHLKGADIAKRSKIMLLSAGLKICTVRHSVCAMLLPQAIAGGLDVAMTCEQMHPPDVFLPCELFKREQLFICSRASVA